MDTSKYKNRVALTQSYKINNFVENICQEQNINSYYGAISFSLEKTLELINYFYENNISVSVNIKYTWSCIDCKRSA